MKIPPEIDQITLLHDTYVAGIFPPLGFIGFEEGNDGGGDYYGLYWEIGKEHQEPIVCQVRHEEYCLVAEYPNLKTFLASYHHPESPLMNGMGLDSTSFFPMPFQKAKILAKNGKIIQSIEKLQISTNLFGEYTHSWALLSEQLRKNGDPHQADVAALNAIRSNWVFELPSQKAITHFEAIDEYGPLCNDPLVKRKTGLMKSGFSYRDKFVVDFDGLLECIAAYHLAKEEHSAFVLEQNYGYWMNKQDLVTQKKFNFEAESWRQTFLKNSSNLMPNKYWNRISLKYT